MPTYPFRCPACGDEREVVKPSSEAHIPEICDKNNCGRMMERIWTAPMLEKPFFPYFDHGLGVRIESKSDKKNAINGLKAKGINVEECGNEKPSYSKPKSNYDIPRGAFDNA